MTIAASKVRTVCTGSEIELVRASRKPVLEQLSQAQLERNIDRARKLFDKWRDVSRGHARARSREVGFGESDANTRLKAQIFGDALKSFEARSARLKSSAVPASKAPAAKTKKHRNAEHRASRAAVRKGMSTVEGLLNAPTRNKKKTGCQACRPRVNTAATSDRDQPTGEKSD